MERSRAWEIDQRIWEIDKRIRWITARMVDGSADSRDETELQELIRERARNLVPKPNRQ